VAIEQAAAAMGTTTWQSKDLHMNGKLVLLLIDCEHPVMHQAQQIQGLLSPCSVFPKEFFKQTVIPVASEWRLSSNSTHFLEVDMFCRRSKCGRFHANPRKADFY
jgi:hypothetical protein